MITVLMPSRGREGQAAEAIAAFNETRTLDDTEMFTVVDWDEPGYSGSDVVRVRHEGGMGPALNGAVDLILAEGEATIIGFIGDDHRFRTPGWDERIEEVNAQAGGALVYGNDLLKGGDLPTAVFIDVRIIRALGWMALPGAKHLYLDDAWRELGTALGRLRYLPDVVIEHMHPTVGKAEWDEGYRRVNEGALYDHDAAIYHRWMAEQIDKDVLAVEAALR